VASEIAHFPTVVGEKQYMTKEIPLNSQYTHTEWAENTWMTF